MNTAIQFFGSSVQNINLDPDYVNALDFAQMSGMPLPSMQKMRKDSFRIVRLKDSGVWPKLDLLYFFDQEIGREEFATTNFINPAKFRAHNEPTLFPSLVPLSGFKGGGGAFIKTGWKANSDSIHMKVNDASVFYKTFEWPLNYTVPSAIGGARTGNNSEQIFIANNAADRIIWRLFNMDSNAVLAQQFINDSIVTIRVADTQTTTRSGGQPARLQTGLPISTMTNQELYLLAYNENSSPQWLSSGGLKYFGAGSDLTGKELDIHNILSN